MCKSNRLPQDGRARITYSRYSDNFRYILRERRVCASLFFFIIALQPFP